MAATPWISIAILVLLVALGVLAWRLKAGKKTPTDYYNLFIMGIIWLPLGLAMGNLAFSAVGLVLASIGLAHKSEWEKNRIACMSLTDEEKKRNKMLAVAAFLIASLLAVYLVLRGAA